MKTLILKSMVRIPLGMLFFLIAMVPVVITHHIVVAVKLPRRVDSLIADVYAIIEAMTANTWFPTPSPSLTVLRGYNDDLSDAQDIAKTRAFGAAKFRNTKKVIVIKAVQALVRYVQDIADAHPDDAEAIIESALMHVKKVYIRQKHVFSAKNLQSCVIELSAAVKGRSDKHEWGISRNPMDPLSWALVPLPSTLKSKLIVDTGLTRGELVYFRHRILNKDGYTAWDDPISIVVS